MQSSECTLWRGLVSGFLVDVVSNDMLSPIIETRAHRSTASFECFLCASPPRIVQTVTLGSRFANNARSAPRLTYRQYCTVFTFTTTMSCVWECCRIAWNKINSLSQTIRSNINPSSTTFYLITVTCQSKLLSVHIVFSYWQLMAWQSYTRCVGIFSIWVK